MKLHKSTQFASANRSIYFNFVPCDVDIFKLTASVESIEREAYGRSDDLSEANQSTLC